MPLFSPRSRNITHDVIWSLGAAVVAVFVMGSATGSLAFPSIAIRTDATGSNTPENAVYRALEAQFDSTGGLTDDLQFAPNEPGQGTTLGPEDNATGALAENSDAETTAGTSSSEAPVEPPRASQQTSGTTTNSAPSSRTQQSDSSAERTPAPASPTPSPEPTRQQQIEAIADRLPFNWRAAGVTLKAECAPNRAHCRWGLYVVSSNTIWVGTDAFANSTRLFYVVAHELAHAWQFSNDPHTRMNDLADWGYTGVDGLEAAADCLAQAWGATMNHYWACPPDAERHMTTVFNGT